LQSKSIFFQQFIHKVSTFSLKSSSTSLIDRIKTGDFMCTIGVVFHDSEILTFKQCDLIPETQFNAPLVKTGENGVGSYIAMTRANTKGIWAGVNDQGVSFVAVDSYTTTSANYYSTSEQANKLFDAYEGSISRHTNARDAAHFLIDFYRESQFPAPDISMITGWADSAKSQPLAILIEYMPNPYNFDPVRTIERTEGHFANTNNFRLQPDSVDYPANHSTYLRLQRAEMLLQQDPSEHGIKTLLTDEYYGKTELSICRSAYKGNAEFHTQATAFFKANLNSKPACEFQINGNPKNNPLQAFAW
jgi:hypothetical protein